MPIEISDDIAKRIASALDDGLPTIAAYVNGDTPTMSFRGTTQVISPNQIAFWSRKAEGGVVDAIKGNPKVTVLYRDPAARVNLFFYGKAHVSSDQAITDRVYNESPAKERDSDAEKKGVAIVIDLDLVQGRTTEGPIKLEK